jgi:WhiB family redox-sensing transcriptional regulator
MTTTYVATSLRPPIRYEPISDIPEWMTEAKCKDADAELFFQPQFEDAALEYCKNCPVKRECRKWAEKFGAYGIFGGRASWATTREPEPPQMQAIPEPKPLSWSTEQQKANDRDRYKRKAARNEYQRAYEKRRRAEDPEYLERIRRYQRERAKRRAK